MCVYALYFTFNQLGQERYLPRQNQISQVSITLLYIIFLLYLKYFKDLVIVRISQESVSPNQQSTSQRN